MEKSEGKEGKKRQGKGEGEGRGEKTEKNKKRDWHKGKEFDIISEHRKGVREVGLWKLNRKTSIQTRIENDSRKRKKTLKA